MENSNYMSLNRMKSRVADSLEYAVSVYRAHGTPEQYLIAAIIMSGMTSGDIKYFESDIFKYHINSLSGVKDIDLDHLTLLGDIRKLYRG